MNMCKICGSFNEGKGDHASTTTCIMTLRDRIEELEKRIKGDHQ